MDRRKKDFFVGIFVIIGMICTGYLIVVLGELSLFGGDRYRVYGYFTSATGLKNGAAVEIAGVRIGRVAAIAIDPDRMAARVTLSIDREIPLTEDTIASVKTSGIIGEKYIDILPGGLDILLSDGDEIENTESSLDIESLIRKFIFSSNDM